MGEEALMVVMGDGHATLKWIAVPARKKDAPVDVRLA